MGNKNRRKDNGTGRNVPVHQAQNVPIGQFMTIPAGNQPNTQNPGFGQTIDPRTGKIYRRQPPKMRSPEFVRISANAENARIELVTYCNQMSYTYDIAQGMCYATIVDNNGATHTAWVQTDDRLNALTQAYKAAKEAVKAYKTSHKHEFVEAQNGPPTMKVVNRPTAGRGNLPPPPPPIIGVSQQLGNSAVADIASFAIAPVPGANVANAPQSVASLQNTADSAVHTPSVGVDQNQTGQPSIRTSPRFSRGNPNKGQTSSG